MTGGQIKATIKITKAKEKENISATISKDKDTGEFRSWNFTGNLVSLEGYIPRNATAGVDYNKELLALDCPSTAIIYDRQLGEDLYNKCQEIFDRRAANNDINPAIDLVLRVNTVRPKHTEEYGPNILLVNVKSAMIDENTQITDDGLRVDDFLRKAAASKPRSQVNAARKGITGAINKVVKSYL